MAMTRCTRRDALRQFVGAALATGVLAAMPACTSRNKKRLVFFFTGTGNSLYVAKHLSPEPISIVQALKGESLDFTADEIGLVYPLYQTRPPEIVKRFLAAATFHTPYLFAVMTYGRNYCDAPELLAQEAAKSGKTFQYMQAIRMQENFLPAFDMAVEAKYTGDMEAMIARTQDELAIGHQGQPVVTEAGRAKRIAGDKKYGLMLPVRAETLYKIRYEDCNNCGKCLDLCPVGAIALKNLRPVHSGECEYCYACIQNCPQHAIGLIAGEKNPNARYRNPHISLYELMVANRK